MIGIVRRKIAQALVMAIVVIVIDEGAGLPFRIAWQELVFQQNQVLDALIPAFNLALAPRVVWRAGEYPELCVSGPAHAVCDTEQLPAGAGSACGSRETRTAP